MKNFFAIVLLVSISSTLAVDDIMKFFMPQLNPNRADANIYDLFNNVKSNKDIKHPSLPKILDQMVQPHPDYQLQSPMIRPLPDQVLEQTMRRNDFNSFFQPNNLKKPSTFDDGFVNTPKLVKSYIFNDPVYKQPYREPLRTEFNPVRDAAGILHPPYEFERFMAPPTIQDKVTRPMADPLLEPIMKKNDFNPYFQPSFLKRPSTLDNEFGILPKQLDVVKTSNLDDPIFKMAYQDTLRNDLKMPFDNFQPPYHYNKLLNTLQNEMLLPPTNQYRDPVFAKEDMRSFFQPIVKNRKQPVFDDSLIVTDDVPEPIRSVEDDLRRHIPVYDEKLDAELAENVIQTSPLNRHRMFY